MRQSALLPGADPDSPPLEKADALMCRAWTFFPLIYAAVFAVLAGTSGTAWGELPNPTLTTVFPAGGQAGTTIEVAVAGSALEVATGLLVNHSGIAAKPVQPGTFAVSIPADTLPGLYELRVAGPNGLSSPRTFFVTPRHAVVETEPNNPPGTAPTVVPGVTISGRIEKGDIDQFQFAAKGGARITIECWAERIDSALRGVLEIYDSQGRRLQVNRGYFGIDPCLDFVVPADGNYTVRLFDLTYSGSADSFYRLDISQDPRVLFSVPSVLERGKKTAVRLYGWNLRPTETTAVAAAVPTAPSSAPAGAGAESLAATTVASAATSSVNSANPVVPLEHSPLEQVRVEVVAPESSELGSLPVRVRSSQVAVDQFAYSYPGSDVPVLIGLTDVPVTSEAASHGAAGSAQEIAVPTEVSGQLSDRNEQDWFAISARRGEVFWLEAFGERIGSPVDLDLSVLDPAGKKELARFSDEVENLGGTTFPSKHLDPAGRWVAPADGRYLILVRNLIGTSETDPRRVYRLSVRREEPDARFVLLTRHGGTLNVPRGGREMGEILAFRRRGEEGTLRVYAQDLPPGIEFPDVHLGPGVSRAPFVISAATDAGPYVGTLTLRGTSGVEEKTSTPRHPVRGGALVRSTLPNGSARIAAEIPFAVAGEASLRVTATAQEARVPQGSVIDVAVGIARRDTAHAADVELWGAGLPDLIGQRQVRIPAARQQGFASFALPVGMPPGRYTFAVRAETTAPLPVEAAAEKQKPGPVVTFSNPVTVEVYPAPFVLEVDPHSPRQIKRGKIAIVKYRAQRKNGFIGKIHTDIGAPGGETGLRGRGVTFVGQTETGEIQVIANEDAPLGRNLSLNLHALGTVEDQPIYRASCLLELEVIE